MKFSVMITTRNRCDDLKVTLTRLAKLHPSPAEVMVCADGCTDGSVLMIQGEFPNTNLIINEIGAGSVASRDRMIRLCKGDWILSLDDDSYPMDNSFFKHVEGIVQQHPEAAVITFPEKRDGEVFASTAKTPQSPGHYTAAYPNCAALMERSFYLSQPGFPQHFFHMYEETDYALQCYAAGKVVWFEPSLTIRHHLSSVERQPVRRHHQNARNELWSVWMRCSWTMIAIVSAFRILRQFQYASTQGIRFVLREPIWWFAAIKGLKECIRHRNPIPWRMYLAWMKLARHPSFSLDDLTNRFGWKTDHAN